MPKTLILLSNAFPYGGKETYLETEVQYYSKDAFSQVYICALNITREQRESIRSLPNGIKVCPVFKASIYVYLLYSVVALFDVNLYREIGKLVRQKKMFIRRLIRLFIYFSRAHYEKNIIQRYLKKEMLLDSNKEGIIYSYRFDYQPYVGLMLKKHLPNFEVVARAHRYDLYEEFNDISYIPMREKLLEDLSKVILISDDGYNYLSNKFPEYQNKMSVSRLGTLDHGATRVPSPEGRLNIVSCSNVVPVKRLELLVKCLGSIKDFNVDWTHYGDGECLEQIKSLCKELLGENIHYSFRGSVPNAEINTDYAKEEYHVFVNVSASEGIPVSIMEAMSFGMPCIATDVGGNSEIVKDSYNGILLGLDFSTEDLSSALRLIMNMSEQEYQRYRSAARRTWEEKYDAERNYSAFVRNLAMETNEADRLARTENIRRGGYLALTNVFIAVAFSGSPKEVIA